MARKPKEHTFFLLRFWRAHRMKCVLGLVVTAMLLLFVSGISMGNIEKSARQMAKEMETERREASAEQAKRRSALATCALAPLPGQCDDTRPQAQRKRPAVGPESKSAAKQARCRQTIASPFIA